MIALGTPVTYHHRAAVARRVKEDHGNRRIWKLLEGVNPREYPRQGEAFYGRGPTRDMFLHWPEIKATFYQGVAKAHLNKTIMVWPEEGSGVVIGRVRRQCGISSPVWRGSGWEGGDYEPGYFSVTQAFRLYAVRHSLDGLDHIFVPEWAIQPMMRFA